MIVEFFKTRKETVQAVLVLAVPVLLVLLIGFFGADLRN